jgi:hypothetical protein
MPFALSHPQDTAERVEGEPFYELSAYSIEASDELPPLWRDFGLRVRAFRALPPCDAVGLLSGDDSTGLVVWPGALALLEWLMYHPRRLTAALTSTVPNSTAHFIELGCGSGIATVGLCALLRRHYDAAHADYEARMLAACAHVWATDGNPDCIELACRNVREQCTADCNQAAAAVHHVTASAELLSWGNTDAARQFLQQRGMSSSSSSPRGPPLVTVVAADVLYDAAAVPLIVSTVATIADVCGSTSGSEDSARAVEWWLAYIPRSLTRAGNEGIFQTLVNALGERDWTYELFPLPKGCVTTGFEGHADCDVPALRGCILVVQVKPATSVDLRERERESLPSHTHGVCGAAIIL